MYYSCKSEIFAKDNDGFHSKSIEDVLNFVFATKTDSILYKKSDYENYTIENKTTRLKMNSDDCIDEKYKMNGVYFLLSENKKKLLYIGKSKDVKKRLAEHLLDCAKNTNSKMGEISEYLKHKNTKKINYCAIKVDSEENASILETLLIWYCLNRKNNDERFDQMFNVRR